MQAKRERKTGVKTQAALAELENFGVFSLGDAKNAGLSQPAVSRMVKSGALVRLGPSLYQVSDGEFDAESLDYVIASKLFGDRAVIGGLTALFHYGLIDEVPEQLWVLVPPSVRSTDRVYKVIRTKRNLSEGITRHPGYNIVTIERAIVDAFIYGSKVGRTRGLATAVRALREKKTTESAIFATAKRMGVLDKIAHVWDAVSIALER